jgi:prepilin-type N-terminal cleavage/methylation domain-containing protein
MIRERGFTLIELLIVVAIIAIVAAIAVPNLLEAQTRAKVSRALADMRTLTTALEAYAADWNLYPPCNSFGIAGNRTPVVTEDYLYLELLSSPVAYTSRAFLPDPFDPDMRIGQIALHEDLPALPGVDADLPASAQWRAFTYTSWNSGGRTTAAGDGFDIESSPRSWLLQSSGPDRHYFNVGGILDSFTADETQDVLYDATNGTVSYGAIFTVGGDVGADYGSGFAQGVRLNR